MKFKELTLTGCFEIQTTCFEDVRGVFSKLYMQSLFLNLNIDFEVKEIFYSRSNKNVLRGMHFQVPPYEQGKLVSCINGEVEDVILDLRLTSKSYGLFEVVSLNPDLNKILYLPPGVAHGFLSKTDDSLVIYGVTAEYSSQHDRGIRWNSFGYTWENIRAPILSERDKKFPPFIFGEKIFT